MTDNVRILPPSSTIPPFPIGGLKDFAQTERYLRQLATSLQQDRSMVGDRVERRVLHGTAAEKPTADGSGNIHYSEDTEELEIDTGTWTELVTAGGVSDHGDLTGLDDETDHPWAVYVGGDTMTGDLIMDACEIYLGVGSVGLIGEYSLGNYANLVRTYGGNSIRFGDLTLATLLYGSNTRPTYYWGVSDYSELVRMADLNFLTLTDVGEPDYTDHAGEPVIVNVAEDGLEFGTGSAGFVKKSGDTMSGPLVMETGAYLSLTVAPGTPGGAGSVYLGKSAGDGLQIENSFNYLMIDVNAAGTEGQFKGGIGIVGFRFWKNVILEDGYGLNVADVSASYTIIENDGTNPLEGVIFGHASLHLDFLGDETRPQYNSNDLALYSDIGSPGTGTFVGLTDTPANYVGHRAKAVRVEDIPTPLQLEFIDLDNLYVNKITGGSFGGEVTMTAVGLVFLNDGDPYCDWLIQASDSSGALAIFDRSGVTEWPFALDIGALRNSFRANQYGVGINKIPILTGELLQVNGGIDIPNTDHYRAWNSGATLYDLIGVNASDGIDLGTAAIRMNLLGLPALPNTSWLYGRNAADTAYEELIRVNSSDQVEVGDATAGRYTYMKGSRLYVDNAIYFGGGLYSTGTVINVYDDIEMQTCNIILYPVGASAILATDAALVDQNLISLQSDNTIIGNDSGRTEIDSNGSVRLHGLTTGLYFETSTGVFGSMLLLAASTFSVGNLGRDLLLITDGDAKLVGGGLNFDTNNSLLSMAGTAVDYDCAYVDGSNNMVFGDLDTVSTWLMGGALKLRGAGYSGTVGPPTTTQWPSAGSWGVHVDTDGDVYIAYNNGGTIQWKKLDNT